MIKFWVNIISLFLLPNFFKIYKPVWEKKKVGHVCQSQFPNAPLPLFPSWCLWVLYVCVSVSVLQIR